MNKQIASFGIWLGICIFIILVSFVISASFIEEKPYKEISVQEASRMWTTIYAW